MKKWKMAFERDINLKIIVEVEKYECLYNSHLSDYTKKDVTERAWRKIAKKINLSVHESKDKWKNIRSAFVRSLKPTERESSKFRKPYYLHDRLLFILPYVKHSNSKESEKPTKSEEPTGTEENILYDDEAPSSLSSISDDGNQSDNTSTSLASTAARKKRKSNDPANFLEYSQNKKENTNTSDDETAKRYFLLSLLPELNGLDEEQMRHFKIQVLMLVDNIKGSSSFVQQSSTYTPPQSSVSETEPPFPPFPKEDPL
ncbi:unnamed protein product [Phaedon cochleariae]|uniref:Transcription factor Adf-1 n=1 Tax=Phaedon cochleariae TaxID=80249 RepID=A0A9P0GN94_PHACE|nr:unnamed protein product [Phaedon cochleariae]